MNPQPAEKEDTMNTGNDDERLLTPGDVRRSFGVTNRTVTRWAETGLLGSIRTPGGHRRYREAEVRALLNNHAEPNQTNTPPAAELTATPNPDPNC
jgi:excisionase family DNA binding protein